MKEFIIGRGSECDIVLNDPSDVISRIHATLVYKDGKFFVIDKSLNGTFVNGMKIKSNSPVPVKRGDNISFAKVESLDWSMIPRQGNLKAWLFTAVSLLTIALAVFAIIRAVSHNHSTSSKYSGGAGGSILGTPALQFEKTNVGSAAVPPSQVVEEQKDSSAQKTVKKTKKNNKNTSSSDTTTILDAIY